MQRWIKINTEITNHWIFQNAEYFKWWFDLLSMASWKDNKVMHDAHLLTLDRGQIIASVSFLSERWKRSKPTIIRFLKLLENEHMITRTLLYRQTPIVTICNYDKYHTQVDTQVDTIVDTQVDTQVDTIVDTNIEYIEYIEYNRKNRIEIKKENLEKEKKKFKIPTIEEVRQYCEERKNGIDAETFWNFYQSKGWKVGKEPMKDWKACVRTWENKRKQENNTNTQQTANGIKLGVGEYIEQQTGRRTYGTGKATIPLTAPPRPTDKYCWNAESPTWIML